MSSDHETLEEAAERVKSRTRPGSDHKAPSEGLTEPDDTTDLTALGIALVKQALETGKMILADASTRDLAPGDILRCAQWAATLNKPKRKSNVLIPREKFLPETG